MSFDGRDFRNALGRFATGVCVITSAPEGQKPFGMTVNSFASVSLDPALVLWSLQNDSECFALFEGADKFAVNILADDQLAISNQFAKRGEHDLPEGSYRIGKTGNPVLKGVLTTFECKIWERYPGGDHTILVGEVLEMENRPNSNGKPLCFYGGGYAEIR